MNYIFHYLLKFNNFIKENNNINEVYYLSIKNNKIIKTNYSKFYFLLLSKLYQFYYLKFLFYIFYYLHPIKRYIYVIDTILNDTSYKIFIDYTKENNLDYLFNYQKYIFYNNKLDDKLINLVCSHIDKNDNLEFNINKYCLSCKYQTLQYILFDININNELKNYIMPDNIKITDLIEMNDIKYEFKDEDFLLDIVSECITELCDNILLSKIKINLY